MEKKRKEIVVGILVVIIIALVAWIIPLIPREIESRKQIDNTVLKSDITERQFPTEPKDRNLAWDSELPNFIEKDMKYLEEGKVETIYYQWYVATITINQEKGLNFGNNEDYYNDMNDFSIYSNEDRLIIYGYIGKTFQRVEIDKNGEIEHQNERYQHLPFDKKGKIIYTKDDANFTLFYNCVNDTLEVYQNGNVISEVKEIGILKEKLGNGLFINERNELGQIYLAEGGKFLKVIRIQLDKDMKIDSDFRFSEHGDFRIKIYDDNKKDREYPDYDIFPCFLAKGERYAIVPTDWNTYDFYTQQFEDKEKIEKPEKQDFSIELKPFSDIFYTAQIQCLDACNWMLEMTLDVNGKRGKNRYRLNGYDASRQISDLESEKIFSIDNEEEFWEAVEEIRNMYTKYYDYPSE